MARFGIALHEDGNTATLDAIRQAEALGVPRVWLTSATDTLTLFTAAAALTSRIGFGTAIVPTYPRHPLVLAQQAAVLETVAPGRLTLGIGPSHRPLMEGMLGLPFVHPLEHLREYVIILRSLLEQGKVDFEGNFFKVHIPAATPAPVPLMVSALRPGSFRLAGELADGAISWICPAPYLREQALPAMREGALQSGRTVPRLVAHCFVCVHPDAPAVREDARKRLRLYPTLPFYSKMLAAAGDSEAAAGKVSDRMIDSVVIYGSEASCSAGLQQFAADAGADDLIASLMVVGPDRGAGLEAGMRVVAGLNSTGEQA